MSKRKSRLIFILLLVCFCGGLLWISLFAPEPDAGDARAPIVSSAAALRTRQDFAKGSRPISIVVLDFNFDDIPDLALINGGTSPNLGSTVSILIGKKDGTFQPGPSFRVGKDPRSAAVGYFKGDEHQDLAVTSFSSGSVTVLLGRGIAESSAFRVPRTIPVGRGPVAVAVGDFNNDWILDLAVANWSSNNVSILLGIGNGSFVRGETLAVGRGPRSVAVADFNSDDLPDLAVANWSSNSVSIFLGNGDGTFEPAQELAAGAGPSSIVAADFNNDDWPDLAVANFNSNNVSILLSNGDGTFEPAKNFGVGAHPLFVVAGDFNGDKIPDLAVANDGSDSVSILLAKGDGTFRPAQDWAVGHHPSAIAVGDFNQDKRLDLAVANHGSGTVSILLGRPDGAFQPARTIDAGRNPPYWSPERGPTFWGYNAGGVKSFNESRAIR